MYRGLGIGEVWVVREGAVQVHRLGAEAYVVVTSSVALPGLDLDLLCRHAVLGTSLTAAVRSFRAALDT